MKFIVLPVSAYQEQFTRIVDAEEAARERCDRYREDFVVLSVEFKVGFQTVSPIRFDDDPTAEKPAARPAGALLYDAK